MHRVLSSYFLIFMLLIAGCGDSGGSGGGGGHHRRDDINAPQPCSYVIADQTDAMEVRFAGLYTSPAYPEGQNPYAEGAAPMEPVCEVQPQSGSESQETTLFTKKVLPILFVPSDQVLEEDGGQILAAYQDRIEQSLARVQGYLRGQFQAADLGSRSFNFDTVRVVQGQMPLAAYYCQGAPCSPEGLPSRVGHELSRRGYPLFTEYQHMMVFVIGGRTVLSTYVRDDFGGSTAMLGDAVIQALPEPDGPGEDGGRQTGSVQGGMVGGDWIVAQIIGRLFNIDDGDEIMGSGPFETAAAFVFDPGSPAQDAHFSISSQSLMALFENPIITFGNLSSGAIEIARHIPATQGELAVPAIDFINDIAFGVDSVLIVYHKPIQDPERDLRSWAVDKDYTKRPSRLAAKLIYLDDQPGDGSYTPGSDPWLSPELMLTSEDTEPLSRTWRRDDGAAIAYDVNRDEFQIVWDRKVAVGAGGSPLRVLFNRSLWGCRISPVGGAVTAEQMLTRLLPEPTFYGMSGHTAIAFCPQADRFVLTWVPGGPSWIPLMNPFDPDPTPDFEMAPMYPLILSGDGTTISPTQIEVGGSTHTLTEMGISPHLIYMDDPDPQRRRFFLTWSELDGTEEEHSDILGYFFDTQGRIVQPDGEWTPTRPDPIPIRLIDRISNMPEAAFDPVNRRLIVAFHEKATEASDGIVTLFLDADSGELISDGVRRVTQNEPGPTDPSIAYMAATEQYLVSFADKTGASQKALSHFLGIPTGTVSLQSLSAAGYNLGERRSLDPSGMNLQPTAVATHATENLGAVAFSNAGGVFVDLHVQATFPATSVCHSEETITISQGELAGTEVIVPRGLAGQCMDFYVHNADDMAAMGGCQALSPAISVGTYQDEFWAEPLEVHLPTDIDPDYFNPLTTSLLCRYSKAGPPFFKQAWFTESDGPTGKIARIGMEQPQTCQVVSCGRIYGVMDQVAAIKEAPLDEVCESLDGMGLLDGFGDMIDLKHAFFVLSTNKQYIGQSGDTSTLEQVWDLWNHRYSAYSHASNSIGVDIPTDLISLSFKAGWAWGRNDSTIDVADFHYRRQLAIQFELPVDLPLIGVDAEAFIMSDDGTIPDMLADPCILGAQAGMNIGVGIPFVDVLPDIPVGIELDEAWGREDYLNKQKAAYDQQMLASSQPPLPADFTFADIGGAIYNEQWVFFGDGPKSTTISSADEAYWTAISIAQATMGGNSKANIAAKAAMAMGRLRHYFQENPYEYIEDGEKLGLHESLPEACYYQQSDAEFAAQYTYPENGQIITKRRDFDLPEGMSISLWHLDHAFCIRSGNTIQAKANYSPFVGETGPAVSSGCSCVEVYNGETFHGTLRCCWDSVDAPCTP